MRAKLRREQFEGENRGIRAELQQRLEATEARSAHELAETRAVLIEQLERKDRELESFSHLLSHNLRAPLRGIDGFSRALLDEHAAQLDATAQGYLRRVRLAAQRMGELIDDLLEFSKIGRARLSIRALDISALAEAVVAELERPEPNRHRTVIVERGLWVEADERLARVMLENLLGNALKFSARKPEARVEFGAVEHQGTLAYFVRDNGAGFDMTYAQKLFQPFQRSHTDADFPGTGIGLATVQRIAELHGGRVWAEAELNQGATFYFTLPRVRTGSMR